MPPASAATGWNPPMGIGIAGMRERVKQLGGILNIQSEPGRGTTISVELPLSEAARIWQRNTEGNYACRKTSITFKAGAESRLIEQRQFCE